MTEEQGKLMFGKALRQIRTKRNLSLRELAKILEFSPAYISDLETSNRLPTLEVISRISKNLVLSEEEVFLLNNGYTYAHPSISIPSDVLYYILENNLIDTIRQLETLDKKGLKIKMLASDLRK